MWLSKYWSNAEAVLDRPTKDLVTPEVEDGILKTGKQVENSRGQVSNIVEQIPVNDTNSTWYKESGKEVKALLRWLWFGESLDKLEKKLVEEKKLKKERKLAKGEYIEQAIEIIKKID